MSAAAGLVLGTTALSTGINGLANFALGKGINRAFSYPPVLASGAATALTISLVTIFYNEIKNQFEDDKNEKIALLSLGAQLLIGAVLPKLLDRQMNVAQLCGLTALSFLSANFSAAITSSILAEDASLMDCLTGLGDRYSNALQWLVGMKG